MINYIDAHPGLGKKGGGKKFDGTPAADTALLTERSPMNRNIDLTLVGCPLLAPGAIYFFDFYTNTDADNFYIVQEVSHEITPGGFETKAKLLKEDGVGSLIRKSDVEGIQKLKSNADSDEQS